MIDDAREQKRISIFDNFDLQSVKDLSVNSKCPCIFKVHHPIPKLF